MIVFVAGMPRSGSMWTYNVTRELLLAADKTVLPRDIPSDERALIHEAFLSVPRDNVSYCIKTHGTIDPDFPNLRIVCNYRDVRESMLSFMRFTHCDFEKGLKAAESMMALTDYYFERDSDHIMRLRYDRIGHEPEKVIEEIRGFLDLHVPVEEIVEIAERYSKNNIEKLIHSFDSIETQSHTLHPEVQPDFELIPNSDGTFRLYHKKTAYQSNHITESGDKWRTELTEEQKKRLMQLASRWLTKYHFVL